MYDVDLTPEPHPLTCAYWKTNRAQSHLDNLKEEVDTFCKDSHTITAQEEPEQDRVRYKVTLKQPHVYIFLILGDFLQCLRTALDQAVWSLIHHRTGGDPESSEFPIFSMPPNNDRLKTRFNRKVEGLSDEAIAYIKSIQPYNRTNPFTSDPLLCLHELNRIDKHRRISVRAQFAPATRSHFGFSPAGIDFPSATEVTDYGYDVVCRGSYKYVKPTVISVVKFGEHESGIDLTISDIAEIYDVVITVLGRLSTFAIKKD